MTRKALYKHKHIGDIFAIETDSDGNIVSTSGPLLSEDFDPKVLDYDEYWNPEVKAKIKDFERITKDDYLELLHKYGFYPEASQKSLLDELK